MEFVIGFRDLKVYKLARQLSKEIFDISMTFPKEEMYSLTDQVRNRDPLVPKSQRLGPKGGNSNTLLANLPMLSEKNSRPSTGLRPLKIAHIFRLPL